MIELPVIPVLTAAEAPAHTHGMTTEGLHHHPLSEDSRYIAYDNEAVLENGNDVHRDGNFYDDGLTTDGGEHTHVAQSTGGAPHYHPFRSVLFCRRK